MEQLLETGSWIGGIIAAVFAGFALIDQLGIRLQRRHRAELWQQEIATARTEPDERTLRMLHRQDLSRIIAASWIPTHRAYIPVAIGAAGLWLTWDFAYRLGKVDPQNLVWGHLLDPVEGPLLAVLVPVWMMGFAISALLRITAQRTYVRRDFLAGRDVDPPSSKKGSYFVLWAAAGPRGYWSPWVGSLAVWGLLSCFVYAGSFGNAEHATTVMPVFVWITLLLAVSCAFLAFDFISAVVTADAVCLDDLYPPHGDYSRLPSPLARAREKRGYHAHKRRRAPWERKQRWMPWGRR